MSEQRNIPLLDVNAQNASLAAEFLVAFERLLKHGHFILGPEVDAFEKEVASYLGVNHAIGVSSGTDALLAALMAIGVGQGDEVITTPFSFFATAGCIARLGARPVFIDIDPETYTLNTDKIEDAITSRTKAIMPVHLYGQPCAMEPIMAIAKERNIAVIEDAAQAIGAKTSIGPVGAVGTYGCFSFFPSKNLGGFGDGGLVTATDPELAEKIRLLRAHGSKPKYYHAVVGGNFRLDALQAAILRVKLPHLDRWAKGRKANVNLYNKAFAQSELPKTHLSTPVEREVGHVWNQYVIRTPFRDGLRTHLQSIGIGTEIYYPLPLHLQQCFASLGYQAGSLPEAERASKEVLALPIYPELAPEKVNIVADEVIRFIQVSS